MAPEQLQSHRKKTSEYQAIWQLLHRVARKDDYRRANRSTQRTMLQNSCNALMEKRQVFLFTLLSLFPRIPPSS
jgi:hypothetical protein